jgi:hypothetical protein
MTKTRLFAVVAGCLASAGLSVVVGEAQSKSDPVVRVTVIGCVRRSSPPPGSPVDTTAIPEGSTRYLLSNITLGGDRATTAEGGGARGDLIAQSVKSYQLDDAGAAQIAPHVGERVEVHGTVISAPQSPRGTAGRGAATPSAPRLRVETIKTIAKNSSVCAQ